MYRYRLHCARSTFNVNIIVFLATLQALTFPLSPTNLPLQAPCHRSSQVRHTSDFKSILDSALTEYEKKTRKQRLGYPVATATMRLCRCHLSHILRPSQGVS
ncbi:hypothetical protein EDB86DRAFT_3039095 [Lactarius hatsudake]|nr:hypothetical protein EDB86DRAFT_3039095 [Lactarius hatsudake]